jgi:hypothetical protein
MRSKHFASRIRSRFLIKVLNRQAGGWRFLALIGLLPVLALAQTARPAQPFQRLDGCVYKPQRWNDGDSFHVILPDRYAPDRYAFS